MTAHRDGGTESAGEYLFSTTGQNCTMGSGGQSSARKSTIHTGEGGVAAFADRSPYTSEMTMLPLDSSTDGSGATAEPRGGPGAWPGVWPLLPLTTTTLCTRTQATYG